MIFNLLLSVETNQQRSSQMSKQKLTEVYFPSKKPSWSSLKR